MRQGKFIDQIAKELEKMDETEVVMRGPHKVVVELGNKIAREHPLQYERFHLSSLFLRAWRKIVGDVRNTLKFLSDERKRSRANRIAYWLLVASLLLATAGICCLIYYVVHL